jgi:hypothetical protein
MAKKWIQKAIKHPGRLTKAAAASGVSKLQKANEWSHSSDPSKRAAGNLGKRFIKGKLHDGGVVPTDGLYELERGEKVMPAHQGQVTDIKEPRSNAYQHHEDVTPPENYNETEATGPGHWEIDCNDAKFVKE